MPVERRGARGWCVVGGMFHLVQRLAGFPWGLVEELLEEQRVVVAGVCNPANVEDQKLLPLTLPLPVREG